MMNWTSEALDLFEKFCEKRRPDLLKAGSDPDEVVADWKTMLEMTAQKRQVTDITVEFLKEELLDIEAPWLLLENAQPEPPHPAQRIVRRVGLTLGGLFTLFFAVLFPIGVLTFELLVGLCEAFLFDPIPTWIHVALIALVPVSNAWILWCLWRRSLNPKRRQIAGVLTGLALGIAAWYALRFILITPFAFMAVAWFGVGLVPLAPLFAFVVGLRVRSRVRWYPQSVPMFRRSLPADKLAPLWKTALPVFLLLCVMFIPQVITAIYMPRLSAPNRTQRVQAVKMLRTFGSKQSLLRDCYRADKDFDILFIFRNGRSFNRRAEARAAYYRVTGTPYFAARYAMIKRPFGGEFQGGEWWDEDLGSDRVSSRLQGLSIIQSRLDGRIHSDSGIAYLEWTMEFKNATWRAQEARALIELPPNAVVSRVTLWINDEPCEAAFGGRAQTKKAYQEVAVRQRRDPLLVTTAGGDRILQQCFPVPANGSMKTRIGITVPLTVYSPDMAEGILRLPAFVEQNFTADADTHTSVWIESDEEAAYTTTGLRIVPATPESKSGIRGKLIPDESADAAIIKVPLSVPYAPIAATDPRLENGHAVEQTLLPAAGEWPTALAIVVDASAKMKAYRDDIAAILKAIPDTTEVLCILADDVPVLHSGKPAPRFFRFVGGCDNIPALEAAAEWAATQHYAPILWLHATQPLDNISAETLSQIFDFSRGKLKIFSHQFGPGSDRVSEKLASTRMIKTIPVFENPADDIAAYFHKQGGFWKRTLRRPDEWPNGVPTATGSTHIVRLWAHDEIAHLSRPFQTHTHSNAIEMATAYQLVTPVSGAVVLETMAQYKAHGLEPAAAHTAPGMVPEPATLLLFLGGGGALLAAGRRRRKRAA